MAQQSQRVATHFPCPVRSMRVNSEIQNPSFSQIDYNNHQQQDYSEPEYKDKRKYQATIIATSNSKRRSFIKKNLNKVDIRQRYLSTQKSEIPNNNQTNKFRQFKEEIKNKISQIPFQPQKPKIKHRYSFADNQESDLAQSDNIKSRMGTENTITHVQNQKQMLICFDTNLFSEAHKILERLQHQIFIGDTSGLVRKYLQIIATGSLDDYSNINLNLHKRKAIKLSILYERISVLLIAFSEVTGNLQTHQNFLSNLLKYVLDNRVIILTVLQNRLEKLEIQKTIVSTQNIRTNKQSRNFQILRDNNQIILQTIYKLSVEDNYFYENLRKFIKGSSTFSIQQCFYFILEYLAFFLHLSGLQQKIPFLAVAPNPYLPESEKYTLVFDFVEIMYNQKFNNFRPYSQIFIQEMSQFYDLVSYSAVYPKEIQQIIKYVDRKNKISHKLYRHHFVKYRSRLQKDLSRLGRPLEKILLLDVQQCVLTPKNCLKIKRWNGVSKDSALHDISQFLASICIKKSNVEEQIINYYSQIQGKRKFKDKNSGYDMKFE